MSSIRVGPPPSFRFVARVFQSELMMANPDRSIHQDIPLYSMELFTILAPDESKTEEILNDPHQLIINRLNFELSERQRYPSSRPTLLPISSHTLLIRLDKRRKELQQQKDDLIKETKAKVAAIDNVRQQLDIFLKVSGTLSTPVSVRG